MPRQARNKSACKIYHVMLRGNEKHNIFNDDEDRIRFLDTLSIKKNENEIEIYAYCLMDNHVHLLTNELEGSLSRAMKCLNVSYAKYFNKKYNRVGHLFQDRFRSEIIDSEKYVLSACRYIHNNPVKAGKVASPENYTWSSYRTYCYEEYTNKLVDINFILSLFSINADIALKEFLKFTTHFEEDEFIDINEAETKQRLSRTECLEHLNNLLKEKGTSLLELKQQKGSIKGTLKHELVVWCKNTTCLSYREIAALLGLSKSLVHELR